MKNKRPKSAVSVPISKVSEEVFDFLFWYYTEYGIFPTLQEIGDRFSKTRQWAKWCLEELQKRKYIKIQRYKHRGISLV